MNSKVLFSCATCGAKFLQWPSQISGKAYCSKSCYGESMRGKVPHNKGKMKVVEKPCDVCGAIISGAPSLVSRRKYCSKECAAKAITNTDVVECLNRHIRHVDGSDCWFWAGTIRGGYGRIRVDGVTKEAHRVSYEHHVGPISYGLVIDHLCRNRSCINPDHLEQVTVAENIRRGDAGKGSRSEEHKAAISAGGKMRFSDPNKRALQIAILNEARKSEKRLINLKSSARDPEYRKKRSEQMKEIWAKRKLGREIC